MAAFFSFWPGTCNIENYRPFIQVEPEPALKTRTRLTPFLSVLAVSILIMASACSSTQSGGASASAALGNGEAQAAPPESQPSDPVSSVQDIPASNDSPTPDGMVAFEGTVYVALTEPAVSRWQSAGWSIAEQPLDTGAEQAPLDCSLYPHSGVQNQWIGGCRGYVLIPHDGAQHIAVMVTNPDGSSTMVQIAPPPGGTAP